MNCENNEIFKNDFYKIYTFLICGIPAIGKSFFCKKLIEEIKKENQLNYNFEIINLSFDKIENINENNYLQFQQMRDDFLKKYNETIDFYFNNIKNKNYFIILDDNFFLKSMRKKIYNSLIDKIIQFKNEQNSFYLEIFLKTNNLDYVIKNNENRKDKIPNNIIIRMNELFEYDSPYIKNKNQKIILVENYNSFDTINFKEIINFGNTIEKKCENKKIIIEKNENAKFIDDIELIIRKEISNIMKDKNNKKKGKIISQMKKEFMKEISNYINLNNCSNEDLNIFFQKNNIKEILSNENIKHSLLLIFKSFIQKNINI